MKTFTKTILVVFLTLGVLIGQTGIATATFSPDRVAACKNCPCDKKKPTCCMEKPQQAPIRHAPAVPQLETRWLQPAALPVSALISPGRDQSFLGISARHVSLASKTSPVRIFLRHRALLI